MHLRSVLLLVVIGVCLNSISFVQGQEAKRPITAEDLLKVKRIGAPSTSPDGQWAVVDVSTITPGTNDSTSELWLLSTDGKTQKQLTRSGGRNSSPKWSPDGQSIAFLSQRAGDEVTQIYVISPEGGEARRVSKMPMAPFGIKWGADSKTIYCTAWTWLDTPCDTTYNRRVKELKEGKTQAYIIEEGTFRYWDRWIADGKRPVVWSVDVTNGQHRNLLAHCQKHLPPYEASEKDYDVSPDGKELAFVSENVKVLGLDTNHDIYTLDLTNKEAEAKNITSDNAANDTNPVYSPDGKNLAFLRQTVKFFYADRFRLMLRNNATGTTKELTASLDRSCGNPVWLPDNNRIAVEIEDSGITNIGFVTVDGKIMRPKEPVSEHAISFAMGNSKQVSKLEGEILDSQLSAAQNAVDVYTKEVPHQKRVGSESDVDLAIARLEQAKQNLIALKLKKINVEGKGLVGQPQKAPRVGVYQVSSFDQPITIMAHRPGSQPLKLEHFNDALVAEWKLGRVENLTFKGADDKNVQMFVIYPPNFDANKKWPLVQMVHGGPHNAFQNDFSYRWNPQVWAAQGWVIAIVNFHGSSGFGQDFTDSITGDMGTKPMTDIMKATEFLCAKPWIDKNRVAAAGASYGGYMMAWLNGHTELFKTMVCHAGVYNWHSMMASDMVRGRARALGAAPWGDLSKIDQQSPQRFAANFKTPTLVVHGEKDFRVPITQGIEYYNTLRQKGVPTRFVYFPDENHWVLKPQNSLLWHKEVFAWLSKTIGNGP
ncbi:MAG: S9 family peptidase [Gemmatales bacterium]